MSELSKHYRKQAIENKIRLNEAFKAAAKVLPKSLIKTLNHLQYRMNSHCKYEVGWPSEAAIARETGQNPRSVRRHIGILKALGMFEVECMKYVEASAYMLAF